MGKCGKRGWVIGKRGWEITGNVGTWEDNENGVGQTGNVVGKMWKTGLGNRGMWLGNYGEREIMGNVG